jgi:antitoxin CptB
MHRDMSRAEVADGPPPPAEALRRLRWRARRGLLENDLLIARFLQQQGETLNGPDADALARLLELSEPELLDLLLGRGAPAPELDIPPVRDLLQRLRAVRLDPLASRTPHRTTGG